MKTLQYGAELYRAIVETAGEGIWVIDANEQTTFVSIQKPFRARELTDKVRSLLELG